MENKKRWLYKSVFLIAILTNLSVTIMIYKKINFDSKLDCTSNAENVSVPFYFGTEKLVSRNWVLDGKRNHLAFGNVCVGSDDIFYAVFRGGYQHGVALNPGNLNYNLGGALYYSVSKDEGKTWSEPICFLEPDESKDLRDPSLMYDSLMDCYFLTYTEVSNDQSSYKIHLVKMSQDKGLCVFNDYKEVDLGINDMSANSACYHQVVRVGSNLYLPFYGKKEGGGVNYIIQDCYKVMHLA